MEVPITGVSNFVDCILLLTAWAYITSRIQQKRDIAPAYIKFFRNYFFFFALFNLCMAAPHLLVRWFPLYFTPVMAWGYVVANVFLLIALMYLSRMTASIVPRFANKDRYIVIFWTALNVVVTILHVAYVGLKYQPAYDYGTNITTFQFPPALSSLLGIVSLLAYGPAIVLFVITTIKSRGQRRLRAGLLAAGMILIMVSGPLHAAAPNLQIFLLADILNVVSLVLLSVGIVFQLNEPSSRVVAPTEAASADLDF